MPDSDAEHLDLLGIFPFGTVLGVFTIFVLSRDSVKRLFGVTP